MLNIRTTVVTEFRQNCRLLIDDTTQKSVVVDPGGDVSLITQMINDSHSTLESIVLTHSHIDHAAGVAGLLRETGDLPLIGNRNGEHMRSRLSDQAMMFGLNPAEFENCPEPTEFFEDGDTLTIGNLKAAALFTPGHSPDHLAFFFERTPWIIDGETGESPVLIAGDALFQGSIGRTDLPGGNHAQLIQSIQEKLLVLPADTIVLPGHGPATTIGIEKRSNPFLQTPDE